MTEELKPGGSGASDSNQPEKTGSDSPPAAAPPPAPPEPLTPERAAAENRRNDLFIAVAVLIAAFLFGFFKINDSDVWLHLRSGWLIARDGIPAKDPFAYPTADQDWVNVNWLYDSALYNTELLETRGRARRLVTEYKKLLAARQAPKLDDQGKDVTQSLSAETLSAMEQAFAELNQSADSSDSFRMRRAAEHAADAIKEAGMEPPPAGQATEQSKYPELLRYAGTGGPAMISLYAPVAVKSLLLVAMAAILLFVRHPGPTSWWTAVIAGLALVAMSERLTLSPHTVSLLLLAAVFWIVHQFQFERTWAIWLLAPLELVWVNVDSLFPLGLAIPAVVLVCQAIGGAPRAGDGSPATSTPAALAGAIAVAGLATLVNPFHVHAWSMPLDWAREMFGRVPWAVAYMFNFFSVDSEWAKQLLEQGDPLAAISGDFAPALSRVYLVEVSNTLPLSVASIPTILCGVLIVLALLSFLLNLRGGASAWRLIVVLMTTTMFLLAGRYQTVAAMTSGVVLALNGQEWFLRRFGTETRISRGWFLWSQGGRAVTIFGAAALALLGTTGWFGGGTRSEFGWGILWLKFDPSAARFLRHAQFTGQMLNTVPAQGNLLIWSNFDPDRPATKVFLDSRVHLHRGHLDEFEALKRNLRDDKQAEWIETLDKLNVSHVLLNISSIKLDDHIIRDGRILGERVTFLRSYDAMRQTEQWNLLHVDSTNVILGRAKVEEGDRLAADAAKMGRLALNAAELVFARDGDRMPDPPPPVRPPSLIDWLWRSRRLPASESLQARNLLDARFATFVPDTPVFLVPTENCFLAIRSARQGLARRQQVASHGYHSLSEAYYYLYNVELSVMPAVEAHELRTLQLLCALKQLVDADPEHIHGQVTLAFRYMMLQYLDLANEHFEAVINLIPEDAAVPVMFEGGQDRPPFMQAFKRDDLIRLSEQLTIDVDRAQSDLDQAGQQLAHPLARMNFLLSRGCPGKAIRDLSELLAMSSGAMDLIPPLANLYLRTGQPGDVSSGAEGELTKLQGNGGLRPGEIEEMWATLKLLQGDYETAKGFMEKGIAETRHAMTLELLASTAQDLRGIAQDQRGGNLLELAKTYVNSAGDATRQARLEYHVGKLQLESGEPKEAIRHFRQALVVRDDLIYRPVIALYLYRLTGEIIPPVPGEPDAKSPDAAPAELPDKPAKKEDSPATDATPKSQGNDN